MSRRLGAAALALTAAGAPFAGVVTAPPAAAAAPRLGLVAETFNVAADGVFDLTLQLPSTVDLTVADTTLVVTAYRPVAARDEVADVLAGELPRSVDSVDLTVEQLQQPAPGQVRALVPLESATRTADALQLSRTGLFPIVVEVQQAGDVVAELQTFVHRLPTDDEGDLAPLPVALVVATQQPVVLDDATRVVLDDATLAELTQLADLLEASAVPLAVQVPPALLTALPGAGADGAALAERLSALLESSELLSSPSLPLDPSLAAAAGQQALYTQWLRDGEDLLSDVAVNPSSRTTTVVTQPLSRAGGSLLRDLGARLLVLPVDLYDTLPDTLGGFTDSSQLVQIEVADGVTVDAAVVDRVLDDTLARTTTTPVLTAILAVTDLLAARQQIEDGGGDPRRHGMTLATPDLSLPPLVTATAVTQLLATTPGLRPTTLDDLGVRTDQLLNDGTEVVVGLPEAIDGSIDERVSTSGALALEAASTASMLPDGDDRVGDWNRLLAVLPTSALTDDQAAAIAGGLRDEFAAVRESIEIPTGFRFTLTGQKGTVPVKLFNNSTTALTVQVRMSSPKLKVSPPQVVTILPGERAEVKIDVEARTRGRFPVTLEVLTPLGDVPLGDPVPLTASVNAMSGLGNLVTGVLLLVLFTWWVRHVRINRRKRAADIAARRHPAQGVDPPDEAPAMAAEYPVGEAVSGGDDSSPHVSIDDSGLSPDASTSTLPPS